MLGIEMRGSVPPEPDYTTLVSRLVEFRAGPLKGKPSDRTLAEAAGCSPTTIGNWLHEGQFPREINQLLKLVRAMGKQAERISATRIPAGVALLDEAMWRRAYTAEARRRAGDTRHGVEAAQARVVLEQMRPGRLLAEAVDPFQLEVHRAISSPVAGLPVLPAYVEREHDRMLVKVVERAADGESGMAVLVGGSSTGKTRTLWEALNCLRECAGPWRLWHPIDPGHPDAVLAQIAEVAAYTVVWLNEAQEYLASDELGEKVAAGLRTLLHDQSRSPVLVLATLWPGHWNTLTTRTSPDRHGQARELLDGHEIKVPDYFTGTDLAALKGTAHDDPRLGEAASRARDGQITQYLAGGPVLLDRYHNAPPAARALIHAAMDARRLGAGPHIPWTWLAQASSGYPTDTEWEAVGNDWNNQLMQDLDYVTRRWNGIPGILTPAHTTTARNQRPGTAAARGRLVQHGPLYRLADYLEQHGRRERADIVPPIDFWTAAARHANPADLTALGDAAWDRGLYRDAAQLHKNATPHSTRAAAALVRHFHLFQPDDHRPVQWTAAHVPLDDPYEVAELLDQLREVGAEEQVAVLARRIAAEPPLNDPYVAGVLLNRLVGVGAEEQVTVLAERAAAETSLDDPEAVVELLDQLRKVGAGKQVAVLARRAAAEAALDIPDGVAALLDQLRKVGAEEQVTVLAGRAAAETPLDDQEAVTVLLGWLLRIGAEEQFAVLAGRAAAETPLDNPEPAGVLLGWLWEAGAEEQVAVLARRVAAEATFDAPYAVDMLLDQLLGVGAEEQVAVLARRAAAEHPLNDPYAVGVLLNRLAGVEADEQFAVVAGRAATETPLHNPKGVAELLVQLREAEADEQLAIVARRAAAETPLDDPYAVAELLVQLREAEADEQLAIVARRAAAETPLDTRTPWAFS
ncbi:hypothetical protein ABT404_10865 [Streptomyces hyaluromycini]|uniref:Uncharacterized protein n=1 Tax=Streptomyces hyaluromycini TaxID=1377993 RepID=A0ABV1WSZ3_9ACTN